MPDVDDQRNHPDVSATTWHRKVLGCAALAAFAVVFCAGLLMDSAPYVESLRAEAVHSCRPAASPSGPGQSTQAGDPLDRPECLQSGASSTARLKPHEKSGFVSNLLLAALTYAPTNVFVLTLLAGFLGGCASQITYINYRRHTAESGAPVGGTDPVSVSFATESPFSAMFRSLAVYLVFMAGIFITAADPFPTSDGGNQTARAGQYARFAATISAFAFAIGYDPKRLADLLGGLPGQRPDPK